MNNLLTIKQSLKIEVFVPNLSTFTKTFAPRVLDKIYFL